MTATGRLDLTLTATPEDVMRGCEALRDFCRERGLSDAVAFDAALVLEEVSANIVEHGYAQKRPGRVSVSAEIAPDALRLEVRDDAPAFNPLAAPVPDLHAQWTEPRLGGLGIHIVRALVAAVEYTRRGEQNCLVLTLRLGSRSRSSPA